jgi:cytochrome b561
MNARFDPISRLFHWPMVMMRIALVELGFYAISLICYDPWYHRVVFWHRFLGVTSFMVVLLRIVWRMTYLPRPWSAGISSWFF